MILKGLFQVEEFTFDLIDRVFILGNVINSSQLKLEKTVLIKNNFTLYYFYFVENKLKKLIRNTINILNYTKYLIFQILNFLLNFRI